MCEIVCEKEDVLNYSESFHGKRVVFEEDKPVRNNFIKSRNEEQEKNESAKK